MVERVDEIKEQWDRRQKELGNTARAVLFKNFPAGFNAWIHRAHVRFLLAGLPESAQRLLDVGCGYGRTAAAIKHVHPNLAIEGVELCAEFGRAFEASVGPCFIGSATGFRAARQYDAITIITLLMYLDTPERQAVLANMWAHLRPGGRLILIEPCLNVLIALRRLLRIRTLAPTGGEVAYFRRRDLEDLWTALPGASPIKVATFGMPFTGFPALHIGAVLEKPASNDGVTPLPSAS